MCTVHRNRTLQRRHIRNVYCAQKQNTFQMVHQKSALCREAEQFSHDTPEMCTVHRNRTLYRRCIRNVYCAQKQNTFQMVIRNVYCAQKQNSLETVHQKCVLCTETEHFTDCTSEMCTVHRNRTLYRRYTLSSIYRSQNGI